MYFVVHSVKYNVESVRMFRNSGEVCVPGGRDKRHSDHLIEDG